MIPITVPSIDNRESEAASRVIQSGWLTQGPRVVEFEESMARSCGTKYAVAVSNCTTALHLAFLALDIGPGDEVICPSMSFIATANAIQHAGATPVFAEVDEQTYNLDPKAAEAAITPRTKAILVVHQIGLPADLDSLLEIGARRGVKIVEDAACAIGSRYRGKPIGGHSEMACFSFHPRKVLTTGDGGMITTNNAGYAERMRLLRQHGMAVSDAVRHTAQRVVFEEYVVLGYNYRMTDVQAAIGIEQLKKLDGIVSRRQFLAQRYNQAFAGHPWISAPVIPDGAEPNFQSYAVQIGPKAPLSRNDLMQHLLERNIATRRGIMLAHLEAPYKSSGVQLPTSTRASNQSLLLPLYPALKESEQDYILNELAALDRMQAAA